MRKVFFTFLSFAFFTSTLCGQSEITQEEYDFFQDYLEKKYVLFRYTAHFDSLILKGARKKLKKVPKELFTEFENRTLKSIRIENKLDGFRFDDEPKPKSNSAKEIHFIFDELLLISRVAFTKDKNQALFFRSTAYEATLGGSSDIYWLVKKNGKWEIKDSYAPYIH